MLWYRIRGLWNTYHGILAVILTVVFWIYLPMMSVVLKDSETPDFQRFFLYNLAAVVGLVIAAIRGRSAAATLLAGGFVQCHTLALKQTVYIGVTMLLVLLAAMDAPVSRALILHRLGGFLLVLYFVFLTCHLFLPKRLAEQLFSDEHEQRTLLIGPVDKARDIAKWIEEVAAGAFGMSGSVTEDDGKESRYLHVTRVSDALMLERIIKNEGIKQILLLEIPLNPEGLDLVVKVAKRSGVRLLVLNNLTEIFNHDVKQFNLHNQAFICLPDEPLEDPISRILKRTMDLVVSVPVVGLVLPPLCIVVKIFQAIQSPGPLLHRETRAGMANLPFRIFLFRTTNVSKRGDPLTYPMGRLLWKSNIDKMPQFFNVFLGHMSLVGPRPNLIIHNRRFGEVVDYYHMRTLAKPGITGLAQMKGYRGEVKDDKDVEERAKLDIQYIESWSLPLDFWIIFKTMLQIVKPPRV